MKNFGHRPKSSGKSHDAASDFARELVDEIARDNYSIRGWKNLVTRSWIRSLEDIHKSPARTRSFWSWVVAVAVMGASIILFTFWFQAPGHAFTASVLWLPWYACTVFFVLTHLGMVDDSNSQPHQSLLLPNGLSFIRLALAPLVLWPCLQVPAHPVTGPIFALFLTALSLSDLADGWVARHQKLCTRMGRMLDVLADLALLTFLAVGLYLAGALPKALLLLIMVRYPFLLIAIFVLYFSRGPAAVRPSFIGKVTTLATSVVLLAVAYKILLSVSWPSPVLIDWSFRLLYFLLSANVLYLGYRGLNWPNDKQDINSDFS